MDSTSENSNTMEAALAIIDKRINSRELIQPHDRAGWVSEFTEDAMRQVFGNATYPYDYHSFAIRFGNASEDIFRNFRVLQGPKVPLYVAGAGVSEEEAAQCWKKYTTAAKGNRTCKRKGDIAIFSRVDTSALAAATAKFYADFTILRKQNMLARLTREDFENFDKSFREANELSTKVNVFLVDYANFRDGYLNLVELKTTGNTDGGKSRDTVTTQLLGSFVAAGNCLKKMFLGIISNSQGICPPDMENHYTGEWGGKLGPYLHKDLILIEEALWALVGPPGMTWYDYQNAMLNKFRASFEWWKKTATERAIISEDETAVKRAVTQAIRDAKKAIKDAETAALKAKKTEEKVIKKAVKDAETAALKAKKTEEKAIKKAVKDAEMAAKVKRAEERAATKAIKNAEAAVLKAKKATEKIDKKAAKQGGTATQAS